MISKEYAAALKTIDLFQYFSDEDLENFVGRVDELDLPAGRNLFYEGDPGQEMYILLRGLLKVFRGNRIIDIIKPGDYLGEMAIIENQPRSASVQALEHSLLLKVPYGVFQEYFSRQPQSLVSMMKTLSQRIRRDTEILADEYEQVNILVHDMKNLITPFHLLELMERRIPELAGDKYLACMVRSRQNLLTLMDRALAYAKRLQTTTPVASGFLKDLIVELVESECVVHPDIGGRDIRVAVVGELPAFPFSSLGMRRVLSNLIVNAAQASKPGSEVAIELSVDNGEAVIRVVDQGQGIAEELQPRIFQPHFTTKEDGNGLGLISCKQIIEETHHGKLAFASTPGQGSTFIVRLPLSRNIG